MTVLETATSRVGSAGLHPVRRFSRWLPDNVAGVIAGGFALVLPVLVIRTTDLPTWSGRYALLVVEAAIGIPLLLALLKTSKRRPAAMAMLFVGVASLSTLLSDNPAMSFWGLEYWGTGLLFVLAMAGIWAIGASAGRTGAKAVERALAVGAVVNAVVAIVQCFLDLTRFGVSRLDDQSTGLVGQPAYLGAILLGGLWLFAARASARKRLVLVAVVVLATALQLSGERLPVVLALLVGVAATRRQPVRVKIMVEVLVLVGLVVGVAISGLSTQTSATASGRLVGEFGQLPRIENYLGAIDAVAERPALGFGPGRYLAGTSSHRTAKLARAHPDTLFADAHNWPLHWAVCTGLLGLAALGAWLLLAARDGSGPLLGFAVSIGVVQLLQPQDVGVTALGVIALGASGAITAPRPVVPIFARIAAALAALVLAVVLLIGMWHAYAGATGQPEEAIRAASWLPHWPDRALTAARASLALEHGSTDERVQAAVRWGEQAVVRDGGDTRVWGSAGYFELIAGHLDAAEYNLQRALQLDPYSAHALTGLGLVELRREHGPEAVRWFERALDINPNETLAFDSLKEAQKLGP